MQNRCRSGAEVRWYSVGHLTTSRVEFQAQVPSVFAEYADFVVLASGVVEIALGMGLIAAVSADGCRIVFLSFLISFFLLFLVRCFCGVHRSGALDLMSCIISFMASVVDLIRVSIWRV